MAELSPATPRKPGVSDRWAGNEKGIPEDPDRCVEAVADRVGWQWNRKPGSGVTVTGASTASNTRGNTLTRRVAMPEPMTHEHALTALGELATCWIDYCWDNPESVAYLMNTIRDEHERLAAENAELRQERIQRIGQAYDQLARGEVLVRADRWEAALRDARRWWAWKHRMTTSSFEPDSYDYDAEADRLVEKGEV